MIEYIGQNLWLFWVIVTCVCLILELSSGDFFVTCFAIGGLFAIIASVSGLPFWAQVLIWAVFSMLSIWLIRPRLLRRFHSKDHERSSNADALIGRVGTVIEPITPQESGYVQVDGDQWKAVSERGEIFRRGEKAKIVSRDSIIVKVRKCNADK
ncbi:MAG: NfeD family protein [Prevotella sp.]|jgi:membrane protein implicated in regulation of membrane protease activity|nr:MULTISPECIES: NfeD family protein [unclassified Prevotella]MCH3970808.1 NfeD family protein [Prevotella sp.]MCH3985691.1 NfeD family protein [Prevotella sp.]MCH3993245.1 NfeD family protein [Prevotella sp.]MCH4017914.1 NfeD family protein [Prevotella sp.]MCH4186675.1 NfeD family protein [Prevotella sp.]